MAEENEWQAIKSTIKYEKGGHRIKHEGKSEHAEIQQSGDIEIGKCPKNFPLSKAQELLKNAIPEYRKTLSDRPKALWNSHEGVVYRALRSDAVGQSWHAFPVKSNIPITIRRQLLEKVKTDEERKTLKKWME